MYLMRDIARPNALCHQDKLRALFRTKCLDDEFKKLTQFLLEEKVFEKLLSLKLVQTEV